MPQENQNIILYNTADGKAHVALYAHDGTVWLNQNQMTELFATSKQNISLHIANILKEKELNYVSVVKEYLTTAVDGKQYRVIFYSLEMIMAVGFRVRSKRGTQFRQWAGRNLAQYLHKGFLVDSERLKNPDGRPDYFDELLEQIRDIRASEKRFYQKLRDLFSLSSDYDKTDKATQMFFAETQNKLLFAVTKQTTAELITARADATEPNMGLNSWKGNIVRIGDITIAKNYLQKDEIDSLNRLVTVFLESAELRVKEQKDLTIVFWKNNVNALLQFQGKEVLSDSGKISNKEMEEKVRGIYNDFNTRRKKIDAEQADINDMNILEELNKKIETREK
ncbi:MAG: virulence RhuM family protein [Proteiniphilum sp.]|nr:virulence RhuM family protein [Proteiniphilum sp.]